MKKFNVTAFDAKATLALVTADHVSATVARELVKLIDMRMVDVCGWLTVCEVHDDVSVPAVSLYEYFLPDNEADLEALLGRITDVG